MAVDEAREAEPRRRAAPDQDTGERGRDRRPDLTRRRLLFAGGAVFAVIMIAGGTYYWLSTRDFEWTDDAFIDGNTAQGAPKVAGRAWRVDFADNKEVR